MLTIRDDQIEAFKADHAQRFEQALADHLNRFFPQRCQDLGADGISQMISLGLGRAREHGFHCERTLCKYLNLMFTLGPDFDRSPQLPWVVEHLAAPGPPGTRMDELYAAALEHVEGEEVGHDPANG